MSRASTSTSIDRKAIKRPDAFVQTGQSWVQRAFADPKKMGILFGGLVVIFAVLMFVSIQKQQTQEKAQDELFVALDGLSQEMKKLYQPEAPKVDPKADKDKKTPPPKPPEPALRSSVQVDQAFASSIQKLKTVATKNAGTRAGFEASFALGELYLRHGKYDQANEWLGKASKNAPSDTDKALVAFASGAALENAGKHQDAINTYQRVLNSPQKAFEAHAMLAIARNQEKVGKNDEAKKLYDQIIKDHAKSPVKAKAELYRSMLN